MSSKHLLLRKDFECTECNYSYIPIYSEPHIPVRLFITSAMRAEAIPITRSAPP